MICIKGLISNSELSRMTSMQLRTIQRLRKSLEDYKYLHKLISRMPRLDFSTRKVMNKDFLNKVKEMTVKDIFKT